MLLIGTLGFALTGCKKENFKNPLNNSLKSGNWEVPFSQVGDVLVFETWDDVRRLESHLDELVNTHLDLYETNYAETLAPLRVTVDGTPYNDSDPNSELTWESELAIDSFEMAIGWSEFQPLIDFEKDNQFNSLRKSHYEFLYGDSEDEKPSKLTDDQRLYLLTFPIYGSLATLFNENAIIGVGDSLYKVLGNNFWIVCHFDEKRDLENINDYNYESYEFDGRFVIYGLNDEKSTCRSNRKRHDSKVTTPVQNYRITTMMTITNVIGMAVGGHFVKGRTICEIKNNKGKWKLRKTFCRVTGAATMRPGISCNQEMWHPAWFNEQHNNRSSRTKTYYAPEAARPFRVKGGEFGTLHEGGVGSNFLSISMTMD